MLSGELVPLPDIQKPENIIVDQDLILITEFPNVYIYSLKDFGLIKKFGKAGEGPREFFQYVRIQYDPKNPRYIVVGSHMKMSYFTRAGEFVKEVRSKTSSTANVYKPLGDHYAAYGFFQDQETKTTYSTIDLYDKDLKKIKQIVRWENIVQQGRDINPTDTDLAGAQFRIFGNQLFFLFRETGRVDVYDENGEKMFSINHDHERRAVTREDEEEFHDFYREDPRYRQFYDVFKARLKFPSHYPAAIDHIVADGRIYVLTHIRENEKSQIVVFDLKGNLLKSVMIPVAFANPRETYPMTINHKKLFMLVDNEDTEEWELHIHAID
jgi:hypothetical protein